MEVALFVIQGLLAGAAFWYSWETRKMRMQNELEVRILSKQSRLSLAPYLVPGVTGVPQEKIIDEIEKDDKIDDNERQQRINLARNTGTIKVVVVQNPTKEKVGCNLQPYLYNKESRNFSECIYGKAYITPGGSETFPVKNTFLSREEVFQRVRGFYGDNVKVLMKNVDISENAGYVVLFFQDIEGSVYMMRRDFEDENGEFTHSGAPRLFSAGL